MAYALRFSSDLRPQRDGLAPGFSKMVIGSHRAQNLVTNKDRETFMIFIIPKKIVSLAAAMLLLAPTLLPSYAAEKSGIRDDEADLWAEIAYVRFEAAKGYDLQSDIRKEAAFRPRGPSDPITPGDELDFAGDEKYLASEDYQTATKHWEKAAKAFRTAGELDKARNAKENAATAWEAARRTLREGIQIHRMAQEYYEAANNLERKTAVLGKIARDLERLLEMKTKDQWGSVSISIPATQMDPSAQSTVGILSRQQPDTSIATISTLSLPEPVA
jgi:tetratricopeptide (TPR) repeat protein